MRAVTHLNFEWKYSPTFLAEQIEPNFNEEKMLSVNLPHTNLELPFSHFDELSSQFVSCYRKTFPVSEYERGRFFQLCFEGIMLSADVYLNGILVGSHKGGYTPFTVDITEAMKFSHDNVLCIKVDSTENKNTPPFGNVVDYLPYGGIYREVRLESFDSLSIADIHVRPRKLADTGWSVEADLYWLNKSGCSWHASAVFNLYYDNKLIVSHAEKRLISKENLSCSTHVITIEKPHCWELDSPSLYRLEAVVHASNRNSAKSVDAAVSAVDTARADLCEIASVRFGFREAEFRHDGFYLNGRHHKLLGLNRHQSFPYVGNAMPKSAQQRDADILKRELGLNFVRSSHYPPSRHFLDRCDEIGLLVFEELPGWQHIGDDAWKALAKNSLEEMIKRDRNHPSVVLWGVRINESNDDDLFYTDTNLLAKSLDASRQTGGVRNFPGSRLLEDVYTYNDFSHHGNNFALQKPGKITKECGVKGRVPYLVTEHNGHMYPTKTTDSEARRTEHALRHLRVQDAMYANKHISGAVGWCFADYNTHRDFGSGDRVCHHGVMDMFRLPKAAAYVYSSQQNELPVMFVSSSMDIGEHDAASLGNVHVFTNCDEVRLYKNDEAIGTFYPDKKLYKGLPHPPIVINDFIGGLLEKNEGMEPRRAESLKRLMRAVMHHGHASMPFWLKIKVVWQLVLNKMSYAKAVELFTNYIGNWGGSSLVWRFEGIKSGKVVSVVKKGPAADGEIFVLPDKKSLYEAETWDSCRVVVRHLDGFGNLCVYSRETVTVSVEGAGKLIGPSCIPLTGGATAFWVRSIGRAGTLRATVKSEHFGSSMISFSVEKV